MDGIPRETQEKLAYSLSSETMDLLPFIPYLLQDFWELGSDPEVMIELIGQHPDKKALFEAYIQNQRNEYDDIDDGLVCVTWALKKR